MEKIKMRIKKQQRQRRLWAILTFQFLLLVLNSISSTSKELSSPSDSPTNEKNLHNEEKKRNTTTITLSNNREIPLVGIGAGNLPHPQIPRTIHTALSYVRLVDTARSSSNEALVSRAVLRWMKTNAAEDNDNVIHVVTKVRYTHLGYERTNLSVRESLNDLSSILSKAPGGWVVRVHVLLQYPRCMDTIQKCEDAEQALDEHTRSIGSNPLLDKDNAWKGSWKALEEMYNAGILESIGISNFDMQDMLTLLDMCTVKPHLYQGSLSTIVYNQPLMDLLQQNDVFFQVYRILQDTVVGRKDKAPKAYGILTRIGLSYEKPNHSITYPPPTILMAWCLQHGYGVIPGASNEQHIIQNSPAALLSLPVFHTRHDMDIETAIRALLSGKDTDDIRYSAIDPDHGVIATFFNAFSKAVKLFLIADGGKHIPVSVWMEPGKTDRVMANQKDIFVAYDGHGNAVKKFCVSQINGGEESFTIEL